jgi:hypothetical protein
MARLQPKVRQSAPARGLAVQHRNPPVAATFLLRLGGTFRAIEIGPLFDHGFMETARPELLTE